MATIQRTLTGVDFKNSDVAGYTKYADKAVVAAAELTVGEYDVNPNERISLGGGKVYVLIMDNA